MSALSGGSMGELRSACNMELPNTFAGINLIPRSIYSKSLVTSNHPPWNTFMAHDGLRDMEKLESVLSFAAVLLLFVLVILKQNVHCIRDMVRRLFKLLSVYAAFLF